LFITDERISNEVQHGQLVYNPIFLHSITCLHCCPRNQRFETMIQNDSKQSLNFNWGAVRPPLSELRLTGIPSIRHKTARNGFLPMHFTALIRKPRCPTPTRKLKNGYVKSMETKRSTGLRQLLLSYLLNHNGRVKVFYAQ